MGGHHWTQAKSTQLNSPHSLTHLPFTTHWRAPSQGFLGVTPHDFESLDLLSQYQISTCFSFPRKSSYSLLSPATCPSNLPAAHSFTQYYSRPPHLLLLSPYTDSLNFLFRAQPICREVSERGWYESYLPTALIIPSSMCILFWRGPGLLISVHFNQGVLWPQIGQVIKGGIMKLNRKVDHIFLGTVFGSFCGGWSFFSWQSQWGTIGFISECFHLVKSSNLSSFLLLCSARMEP